MPKFDWTQVSGYREDMTAEERVALLENENALPEPPSTVDKKLYDKLSSDYAEAKRQLRSRQTEEEARAAEQEASRLAMEEELNTLRREKTLAGYRASFMSLGYAEEMAGQAAEALCDGKTDDVFALMRRCRENEEKAMRAKIMNETPVPPPNEGKGSPDGEMQRLRRAMGLPEKSTS